MAAATNILIFGASGHGRVVLGNFAGRPSYKVLGFIDDDPGLSGKPVDGLTVLGGMDRLRTLLQQGVQGAIVAIGRNDVRCEKAELLQSMGFELVRAVHASAVLGSDVSVGGGSAVMAGTVINAGTTIGTNVIVNTGATVDHECELADGCHISPGSHLAGNVHVGRCAHIGIGSSVVPNIRIGEGSIIGAGSVVLNDVPSHQTWVGNPAKRLR